MPLRGILRAVPVDREYMVHVSASGALLHATAFYLIDTILAVVSRLDGHYRCCNFRAC